MLGAVGFLGLAITAGAYAYTAYMKYGRVPLRQRQLFVSAFTILSLTALVWMSAFFMSDQIVIDLVYMSDIMLVAATVCMLGVIFDIAKPHILALITLACSGFLMFRGLVDPPKAFIEGGILHFNLTQVEAVVIGLVFLSIWLPACIKVVHIVFGTKQLSPYRNIVSYVFAGTVLMASFFLAARQPIVIVISFASIVLFFAVLTYLNTAFINMIYKIEKDRSHAKR